MVTYDLGKDVAENTLDFLVWRARCIEGYAQVEQSLNSAFADLIGTTPKLAGIVFFRLTNTHSRNAILSELLTERHGTTFDIYWHGIPNTPNRRGLMTIIRQLDSRRNEIVHWHTINEVSVKGGKAVGNLRLGKPNFWTWTPESPEISVAEMQEFHAKADFVWRSLNMFLMITGEMAQKMDAEKLKTWREICQQPCIYPPPDNHPLAPKHEAPQNPPAPSVG